MTVKVLICDDSAVMRDLIAGALGREATFEIVARAASAAEARRVLETTPVDVITLDVEMPGDNGLVFLAELMRTSPRPVVMVSGRTSRGADATLAALEAGAVDAIAKPEALDEAAFERFSFDLRRRVRAAARVTVRARAPSPRPAAAARSPMHTPAITPAKSPPPALAPRCPGLVVAIGASTGGVEVVRDLLAQLTPGSATVVIAQHLPGPFTGRLAARLERSAGWTCAEAVDAAVLTPGTVVIAPGGRTLEVRAGLAGLRARVREPRAEERYAPSIDALFRSLALGHGTKSIGVVLSGMGEDGARGLLALRQAGAQTLAQDPATAVAPGMPTAARHLGAAVTVGNVREIANRIEELTRAAPAAGAPEETRCA